MRFRDDELTTLRRDRIGTVFQFFNLLPTLTIEENVALPLRLQNRPQAEIAPRVHAVLLSVGIAEKAGALPRQVSGGQLQRAAIARAVVHEPAIVLADEPTGNLDSHNGEIVLGILRDLAMRGQAILMATHSTEAASARRPPYPHARRPYRSDRMSPAATLFRALVSGYVRRHALRAAVTLFAVALGVASAYAIDLADSTAIASFAGSVNVIANRVNLQVVATGDGFDERALLRDRTPARRSFR